MNPRVANLSFMRFWLRVHSSLGERGQLRLDYNAITAPPGAPERNNSTTTVWLKNSTIPVSSVYCKEDNRPHFTLQKELER